MAESPPLQVVHRDLAARNVLLTAQLTPKICDFGLTRPTGDNDYYRKTTKVRHVLVHYSADAVNKGLRHKCIIV